MIRQIRFRFFAGVGYAIVPSSYALVLLIVPLLFAAASSAGEPPKIEQVGLVAPDILGLTITAGRVEYGRQIPYQKQDGDTTSPTDIHRFVVRQSKVIETLIGQNGEPLCTMDQIFGEKLDPVWADSTETYRVQSKDDPQYSDAQKPKMVYRKTKPSDLGMSAHTSLIHRPRVSCT